MWIGEWNDAIRKSVWHFREGAWGEAEEVISAAREMLDGRQPPDIGLLLRHYVQGAGSFADPTHFGLRRIITQIGRKFSLLQPDGDFFEKNWLLRPEFVETYCPDLARNIFSVRSNEALERVQLLEPCPNEAMYLRLPPPLGNLIRRSKRAPLWMYSTDDAIAYVHPFQYQMLSKDELSFWDSGSPRVLAKYPLLQSRRLETDKNLVIVQDRFDYRNFCHFLGEGITRLLFYVENCGYSEDDVFVFGSVPDSYHDLIFSALQDLKGIGPGSLFFPTEGLLLSTSKKCFWFSDQKDAYTRPAQMAHPTSVGWLRKLICRIAAGGDSSIKKIYVSRADATRRRISNEPELIAALREHGFHPVELGRLTATEQIGLFRNAEIVIGPHGMGLTHILAGNNLGRVIELFNPTKGDEAYAFYARSMGMSYDFLIGSEVPDSPGDYSIPVEQVLALLGPSDSPRIMPGLTKAANLIPGSKTFAGFSAPNITDSGYAYERMIWDQHTFVHQITPQVGYPERGRWQGIAIIPGKTYTASCWLLIRSGFEGTRIFIEVSNWGGQIYRNADLNCRDKWQRISTTARAPESARSCWIGLRVEGTQGSSVASTCWQFERGALATAYVSTP
jgi:hypothetical protein